LIPGLFCKRSLRNALLFRPFPAIAIGEVSARSVFRPFFAV